MDVTQKQEDEGYIGPYRATRLWNDVIAAFRQYMPCGRHRRYMKTFDNCFSGSAAIEWLHEYLKTNSNFNTDVSREKAETLLNKVYRAGIFEEVKLSKSMRHKPDIQENRLYRFAPSSPSKMKLFRLPLAPRNDAGINRPLHKSKSDSYYDTEKPKESKQDRGKAETDVAEKKPQSKLARKISILKKERNQKEEDKENQESYPPCHLITRILTTKEIKDTWKAVFIQRLKKTLGVNSLSDIISTDIIDGYNVMHNCMYLNKSGIVTNIDAQEQLPHWVMSAMKCLARWPEPPEPGLPSYPGFEKDVFSVVKDYFLSQDEPLVPFTLYDVMTNVFVMAGNNLPRHSSPHLYEQESTVPSTLWTSASLENIILNLTKKYCLLDNTENPYCSHEDIQHPNNLDQLYESQEDLRFAGHLDQNFSNYNYSSYPSTDGMDKTGRSRSHNNPFFEGLSYGLATQESCPSLHALSAKDGLKALSRTTQSAGEAYTHSDSWLASISRKYGSTPNLKVSKYETAFGPDNRTVTRVYYQNGITTDYGHDDNDEEDEDSGDVYPSIDAQAKRNKDIQPTYCPSVSKNTRSPIARSVSCVDVASPIQVRVEAPVFGSLKRSENRHNTSMNESLLRKTETNSSFSESRKTRCGQHSGNSKEPSSFSAYRFNTPGPVVHMLEDEDDEPVHQVSFLSAASHHSHTGSIQVNPTTLDLPQTPVRTDKFNTWSRLESTSDLNNSQIEPHFSQAKLSVVSPPHFYATEERSSPSLTRHQSLQRKYGPGYKTTREAQLERPLSSSNIAGSTLSVHFEEYDCKNASVASENRTKCSGYGPGYRPSSESFGPGYKPVLDASKSREWFSNTNLASLQHAPPRTRLPVSFNSSSSQTSTPFSPSYYRHASSSCDVNNPRGLSFSNITPFCSSIRCGDNARTSAFMNYPQNRLSEDRAKSSLQMICLLLPPANRRKLNLLFKMMVKMTSNPNLCLDPTQTTRSLVLGTFYPAIIRSQEGCDLDELVVLQLVSFMLDFYADIFTPPVDIKAQVSDRLKILQRPQVIYSPRPERVVRFCQQTSVMDFENQRVTSSERALQDLLEGIISDKNMGMKEKKKRLKQFQRTYPTIYTRRFPNPESEATVIPPKPKVKQPLMVRPLNKLKGLRL